LVAALLVFVLLGETFMPQIMGVIAPGFDSDPGKFNLAVDLGRITFPYLLFIALVALQGGVLNSVERFAAAAATPIFLNLFLIAALLMMDRFGWRDGRTLAWAVTAAGFAQFLWLLFSCARAGLALRLPLPRLTPAVKRTLAVMAPGTVGAGVTQVNLLISTALASMLPGGSVAYLYYADRLNQLPLGVVGIAVGTAILPPLSRQIRLGHFGEAVVTQNRGLELALLLTLPAAIALGVLANPILSVLFQRGAFDTADTAATAAALSAYAAGLPAFVLVKVLAPAFFARHDTGTPVRVAVAAVAANVGLTLLLMQFLAHIGIALATTVAGWVNALTLLMILLCRGHFAFDLRARRNLPRIGVAALGMGLVLAILRAALDPTLAGPAVARVGALAGLVCAGLATFALLSLALGIADWRELLGRLRGQAA
jgi:putative peptidoglycan lipid II flippase